MIAPALASNYNVVTMEKTMSRYRTNNCDHPYDDEPAEPLVKLSQIAVGPPSVSGDPVFRYRTATVRAKWLGEHMAAGTASPLETIEFGRLAELIGEVRVALNDTVPDELEFVADHYGPAWAKSLYQSLPTHITEAVNWATVADTLMEDWASARYGGMMYWFRTEHTGEDK